MSDEPAEDGGAGSRDEPRTVPSTEVVVPERRPLVVAPARRTRLAAELRGRLPELRRRLVELGRHPAAVASVSAATTVGGALLLNGLRHALRATAAARPGPAASAGSLAVGYVLHEVHVIHHIVAHVERRDRPERPELLPGPW
jgi:hypothetical protein